MRRRTVLAGIGMGLAVPALARGPAFGGAAFRDTVAALDRDSRGRLGVALLDTATGARFAWRADERFPMCSTFKTLLVGAILARVDRGSERLDRGIAVRPVDHVANSPVTDRRVGTAMTIAELCAATLTTSDNAAANLLLPAAGGPVGVTRFLRTLGDPSTRLDRTEPTLNNVPPGDTRDTTTPAAMVETLRRLTLGDILTAASRARLVGWMEATTTGEKRLRAGLPHNWRGADRTGAWSSDDRRNSDNVVALLWPASARPPLLVASYIAGSPLDLADTNAIHARLARAIASAV